MLDQFIDDGNATHLAKMGILDRNSQLYKKKCADASFYPFSIVTEDKRIELIATNIQSLEIWLVGLNYLVLNKRNLKKIIQMI